MKRFEVRVAEGVRLGVVRSAGRVFVRGEVAMVGEDEAGLEEWRGCKLLEVKSMDAGGQPPATPAGGLRTPGPLSKEHEWNGVKEKRVRKGRGKRGGANAVAAVGE